MSGHVVEDVIGKSSKQNNYEVWDVEVAGVYKGALTAEQHLYGSVLDFFHKAMEGGSSRLGRRIAFSQ
jgi:hypothetical protein